MIGLVTERPHVARHLMWGRLATYPRPQPSSSSESTEAFLMGIRGVKTRFPLMTSVVLLISIPDASRGLVAGAGSSVFLRLREILKEKTAGPAGSHRKWTSLAPVVCALRTSTLNSGCRHGF